MLRERARYDMNVAKFATAVAELASRDRNAREDADQISLTLHIHLPQHRAELGPQLGLVTGREGRQALIF